MLEPVAQPLALRRADNAGGPLGREFRLLQGHRDQLPRQQAAQYARYGLGVAGGEVAQQAGVELLFVERRLEVEFQLHRSARAQGVHHPAAQGEDHRAAQAEIGTGQLAEGFGPFAAIDEQPHQGVAQLQAGHATGEVAGHDQRHECRPFRNDAVADPGRQPAAVAGGAGERVGAAAGGEHDRVAGQGLAPTDHPDQPTVRDQQPFHRGVGAQSHAQPSAPAVERGQHLRGLARGREDATAALNDHGQAEFGQEGKQFRGEKTVKGLAEEGAGGAEVAEEVGERGNVGQVAAALAGDAQLAPGPVHLFEHQHRCPGCGRLAGGHQPGRTTADNEQAAGAGRHRVVRQGLGGYDIHDPLLLHHGRQKGINIHRRASAG